MPDYLIICETLNTECFINHYHAFKISRLSVPFYVFKKQNDLVDYSVLGLYKSFYVVLKYLVF